MKITKAIKIDVEHEGWLSRHPEINLSELVRKMLDAGIEKEKRPHQATPLKAVIVAAGFEKRLLPLNQEVPKAMLDIKGKTILERQIELLNKFGILSIAVVRGYKKEKINYPGIRYYENDKYKEGHILSSLFCAEQELDGAFIFLYGDIIFEESVLSKLLLSKADISLIIDRNWREHYRNRSEGSVKEAELVVLDESQGRIIQIGRGFNPTKADGEFIGLAIFSAEGAKILREERKKFLNYLAHKYVNKWMAQRVFSKASFIDIIDWLIKEGYKISPISIYDDWLDIDTFEDYRKAWAVLSR